MTPALIYPPIISSDAAWAYTRAHGWQPRPGTHPKPPRRERVQGDPGPEPDET